MSSGVLLTPAHHPDSPIPTAASTMQKAKLTQKAESRCSSSRSSRWTIAVETPCSWMSQMSATNAPAIVTTPNASGPRIAASRIMNTVVIPRWPQVRAKAHFSE